jgi:hypothetical protein
MTPIERLVDYFGGQTKTALALGVSQTAVSYWVSGIPLMSAEKAFKAEELTADKSPLVRFVLAISPLVNPPPNPALSHRKRK